MSVAKTKPLTIPQRVTANLDLPEFGTFLRLLYLDREPEEFSYAEFVKRSAAWTHFYQSLGLAAGDRLIIILQHSLDLYVAFTGALLGGMVPAMFAFPSPKFSEQEYFKTIGQLIQNAHPKILLTFHELKDKLKKAVTSVPDFAGIYTPEDLSPSANPIAVETESNPDAIAFLQYSSGTTGLKKGVAISHRALLWQIEAYSRAIQLNPSRDVIASWLPLYHDMGLIASFFLPLMTKTPLVALSPFDWVKRPSLLLRAITEYRGTLCWLPNFAYNFLAKRIPADELQGIELSSLRALINCSEPILHESHRVFADAFARYGFRREALCGSYAMAENTFAVTSGGLDRPLTVDWVNGLEIQKSGKAAPISRDERSAKALVSSGQILPETDVRIVAQDGTDRPERQVGEIVLKSPCLLSEYYRNPEETAKSIRGGWYWTGDLGYRVGDEMFVVGRKKDMLIIAGQNIYPQDLEAILNEIPGVHPGRTAVIGVPNADLGTEEVVVLAETSETDPAVKEKIRNKIFGQIASRTEVVLRDVRLLPPMWLLKSSSGKISRSANRQKYLELVNEEGNDQKPNKETSSMPTQTDTELLVADCARRILKQLGSSKGSTLGMDEPLMASGLIDSLKLAALISEMESVCGVHIPETVLESLEKFDSIRGLAQMIEDLKNDQPAQTSCKSHPLPDSPADIPMRLEVKKALRTTTGFWTWYYRFRFWQLGIRCGKGLKVLGPLVLRLVGNPRNITIGDNVTLMPMVDLKIRENGKIILHDGVVLDTLVRIVAANDAIVELGDDTQIGFGTVINAGTDVRIGRECAVAGFCNIFSSEHEIKKGIPILNQKYVYAPVYMDEGAWLAANVYVGRGVRIGRGAIVGIKSVVTSDVPPNAVCLGNPARIVKYRSD